MAAMVSRAVTRPARLLVVLLPAAARHRGRRRRDLDISVLLWVRELDGAMAIAVLGM
jgi:hypothetical protein